MQRDVQTYLHQRVLSHRLRAIQDDDDVQPDARGVPADGHAEFVVQFASAVGVCIESVQIRRVLD